MEGQGEASSGEVLRGVDSGRRILVAAPLKRERFLLSARLARPGWGIGREGFEHFLARGVDQDAGVSTILASFVSEVCPEWAGIARNL